MRVRYYNVIAADCTSDPHPVDYEGASDLIATMLNDIVRVCASDMVSHVRTVMGHLGDQRFESDYYIDDDNRSDLVCTTGPMAVKHKTQGLYFLTDAPDADDDGHVIKHLPPGLTGLKAFVKTALAPASAIKLEDLSLTVGVVWTRVGSASCSDSIEINGEHASGACVNYGSQDWNIDEAGYRPWCQAMQDFLGRGFPVDHGDKGQGFDNDSETTG